MLRTTLSTLFWLNPSVRPLSFPRRILELVHVFCFCFCFCLKKKNNNNNSDSTFTRMHIVPNELGSTKMSPQALEDLINEDIAEGKMPSILIALVGTHLTGEVDDLKTLRAICDKHSIWLHVEGFGYSISILLFLFSFSFLLLLLLFLAMVLQCSVFPRVSLRP
jgi:hypothetical protein